MGRAVQKLKALSVERLTKKPGLYSDGGGLCLRVSSPTARSWVLRYMLAGNAHEMGLGPYPDVSLAEARKLKAQGKNPITQREVQRTQERTDAARSVTFRHCATAYTAARKHSWSNAKHNTKWEATLNAYAMPIIGDVPVQSVDVAMVHRILELIWFKKTKTASRLRGRVEAILDWATTRGYRQGENAARWKGHLENLFPRRSKVRKVLRHPALPYSEIGTFIAGLETEEATGALALQFMILTAARADEIIGAMWDEIDLENGIWTLTAERMKSDREHRVPLSTRALTILRKQHKATGGAGFVFPGAKKAKPLSNMAMLQTLRRMGQGDLTVHGFRATFRDWTAERTIVQCVVADAALEHVVDKVEAAYRRSDLFAKQQN